MIKIDEIEQFEHNCLPEINHSYWELNDKTFPKEMENFVPEVKAKFACIFDELGVILDKKKCQVGEITISFIRQSAREERQRAIIEAFDSVEVDKKLLYSDELDVSWLFSTWQDYRNLIIQEIKKQMLTSVINDSYIIWFMEKSITNLVMVLYQAIRSILLDADEIENFDKLKFQEGFRISVGEYNDWQNIVFFVPPQMRIEEDNELPLVFQRVENLNFGGKTFKDKDLTAAKFINCGFERCIFENVSLNEARFVNCRFKDVIMKNGTMISTGFMKCSLVNLDTRTMEYKGSYVSDCVMENVVMD